MHIAVWSMTRREERKQSDDGTATRVSTSVGHVPLHRRMRGEGRGRRGGGRRKGEGRRGEGAGRGLGSMQAKTEPFFHSSHVCEN